MLFKWLAWVALGVFKTVIVNLGNFSTGTFGTILKKLCPSEGAALLVARDVTKYPKMYRSASPHLIMPSKMSIVPRLRSFPSMDPSLHRMSENSDTLYSQPFRLCH